MSFQLGKSLLNLATLLTGNEPSQPKVERSNPKPRDTPTVPRRPPRRKLSLDRSRHKSLTGGQLRVEETIAEVDSSSSSPSLERGPKVPMPGETLAVRKPSVPQPGQPRVPSPTSTVNTLELIGSPVINRPRVQQPRAESHLSPAVRNRLPK